MPPLALQLDTTTPQLAVDLAILTIVAVQVLLGWRYGLVRRALMLLATFPAVVGASYSGNAFAGLVRPHSVDAGAAGFLAVFAVLILGFEILGAMYTRQLQQLMVVLFDRISGAAAGLLVGLLQVGVLGLVTLAAGEAGGTAMTPLAGTVRSATLGSGIASLRPGVEAVLKPVLPGDLPAHLASAGSVAASGG